MTRNATKVIALLVLVLAMGIGAPALGADKKPAPKVKTGAVCPKKAPTKAVAKAGKKNQAAKSNVKLVAAKTAQTLPKLLDLGSDKCIPCKMMTPILDEIKKDYKGQLDVQFIDVWKDTKAGEKYGVRSIPTQIFYDAKGKEVFRHVGFFAKEDILKAFEKQGIKLKKPAEPKKPEKK